MKDKIIYRFSALLLALTAVFVTSEYQSIRAQENSSNTTLEEVAEQEAIPGEEVSIRGEVEEVESGVSFVMEEEGLFEGDEVLVINVSEQIVPEDTEDLQLQVTGEVGTLVLAEVEQEYGLDLDPELYTEYETKPVVFATYIVVSPDLEDISENPDSYYGQEIALEGEVEQIRSDYSFTLKEGQLIGGEDLLVINASGEPIPAENEAVVVTGTVRPFVKAEFDRDYDLTWDLDVQEEIEAEYSEKPVFVVDSIYPAAKDENLGFFE